MSLVHNMKHTLSQEGKQINPHSNSIALFNLAHPNAKEDEIKKFAEENKINSQLVKEIFINIRYLAISKKGITRMKLT